MVTISHIVRKMVDEKIYLQEAIGKGIASYGSVAKKLRPDIEKELKKEVAHYAIVAALRRYAQKMDAKFKDIKFFSQDSEVNLKTNIVDITIHKTPCLFDKLKKIYDVVKFDNGDILHIITGKNSVNIVTNERYKEEICRILKYERIQDLEDDLVALSFSMDENMQNTPGVLYQLVRNFAWEDINLIDFVSIDLEMTFIISEKDALSGYKSLKKMINS